MEGCIELVGYIEYDKRLLRRGSAEGCSKLLASLSTIKDSYAVDGWSISYTMKVWKWILRHGSAEGCIELVGYIEYHKGSCAVEAQSVVLSWLDALSTVNWLHQVP